MILNFDASVTDRERTWAQEAVAHAVGSGFPADNLAVTITVYTVTEPAAPGHSDYMATLYSGGLEMTIQIRRHADEIAASFVQGLPDVQRDLEQFFKESFIHELGHVVTFLTLATDDLKAQAAALFHYEAHGSRAGQQGTLADWNPLNQRWEDRIQEAVAEVFKDAYVTWEPQVYENRTSWTIEPDAFRDLMRLALTGIGGSFIGYTGIPGDWAPYSAIVDPFMQEIEQEPEGSFDIGLRRYFRWGPWQGIQIPLPADYDPPRPFRFTLSYGDLWNGRHYLNADYTVEATLADSIGTIYTFGPVHVLGEDFGLGPPIEVNDEIDPGRAVDVGTLQGTVTIEGWVPAPIGRERGQGGFVDWGYFSYPFRIGSGPPSDDSLPPYPYSSPLGDASITGSQESRTRNRVVVGRS